MTDEMDDIHVSRFRQSIGQISSARMVANDSVERHFTFFHSQRERAFEKRQRILSLGRNGQVRNGATHFGSAGQAARHFHAPYETNIRRRTPETPVRRAKRFPRNIVKGKTSVDYDLVEAQTHERRRSTVTWYARDELADIAREKGGMKLLCEVCLVLIEPLARLRRSLDALRERRQLYDDLRVEPHVRFRTQAAACGQ
jgi:hypothetical protein